MTTAEETYCVTDAETGAVLASFSAAPGAYTVPGAVSAASRVAKRHAREGRAALISCPGLPTRRYSPRSIRHIYHPYEVEAGCGHWSRPERTNIAPAQCKRCRREARKRGEDSPDSA